MYKQEQPTRYRTHPSRRPVNSFNVAEIARMIRKPYWWVWDRLRKWKVPSFKYHGQVWVVKHDVQAFLMMLAKLEKTEVVSHGTNNKVSAQRAETRGVVSSHEN